MTKRLVEGFALFTASIMITMFFTPGAHAAVGDSLTVGKTYELWMDNTAENDAGLMITYPENIPENIPPENIPPLPEGALRVSDVRADQKVDFIYAGDVMKIVVTPSENAAWMILRLISLEALPAEAPRLDNGMSQYGSFEVELEAMGADNRPLKDLTVTMEFRVPKEWLEKENITGVKLYHEEDNEWVGLPTRLFKDAFDYRYYEAQVPSLSRFVIAGKRVSISPPPASGEVTQPPTSRPPRAGLTPLILTAIGGFAAAIAVSYAIYRWSRAKLERRIERAEVEKPLEMEEIIRAAEERARRRAEEEQEEGE